MDNKCEIVQDLLPLYIDNVCSGSSAKLVKEHLTQCGECGELYEKMKTDEYGDALKEETDGVLTHHARAQKKRTFIAGACIAGVLCIPIIVCLIVNLAVGHALDWFFIVLTSLLLLASITVVPLMAEKNKGIITLTSFTVSLMLLLMTCAIFTGGDWFWISAVPALFGLCVVFMPYIAYKLPLDGFWKKNKGLLVFAVDTFMLAAMLLCIGIYVKSDLYRRLTPPITLFAAGTVWIIFLVCRYLRVSRFTRGGISSIITGAMVFISDYFVGSMSGEDRSLPHCRLSDWRTENIDGNIKWIILLGCAALGAILITTGIIRDIKRVHKNDR